MHDVRRPNTAKLVVGSCMYIQLSVISVSVSTDTVSSSNYQNVRIVQEEQDWPECTALRDSVVDFRVHGVLVSNSDSLYTTGDETLNPRKRFITEAKGVIQSVNEKSAQRRRKRCVARWL